MTGPGPVRAAARARARVRRLVPAARGSSEWAATIRALAPRADATFVYFNNDEKRIRAAQRGDAARAARRLRGMKRPLRKRMVTIRANWYEPFAREASTVAAWTARTFCKACR